MKIKLDSESGLRADEGPADAVQQPSVSSDAEAPAALPVASRVRADAAQRVRAVIDKALNGELDRPAGIGACLAVLGPQHIQVILDKVATDDNNAVIGQRHGFTKEHVSSILCHPDAKRIKAVISGGIADNLVDDVAERIKQSASEALEIKLALMRTSEHEKLRDKIATDILDRAGFGERKHVDIEQTHVHTFSMPRTEAAEFAAALNEANRVALIDYTPHLASSKPQGNESEVALPSGPRQPEVDDGASSSASSAAPSREEAA